MKKFKLKLLLLLAGYKIRKGRRLLRKCKKLQFKCNSLFNQVSHIHENVRIQGGLK